jgi:hypothetical protein
MGLTTAHDGTMFVFRGKDQMKTTRYSEWIERLLGEFDGAIPVVEMDLGDTRRVPNQSMRAMVFGLAALALVATLSGVGCATAPRSVEVETVGALSASTTHVYAAPVHATSDLAPVGFVVGGDDDAATVAAVADAEAPAIAPKASLVMGGAR